MIDWGEMFGKATYDLWGDVYMLKQVQKVVAAVRVALTPNTEAVIQAILTKTSM